MRSDLLLVGRRPRAGADCRRERMDEEIAMENPATWGRAEQVVNQAIRNHMIARDAGVVGLSLARSITDALRNHGLLPEEDGEIRNESSGAPQAGLRAEVVGDDLHEHLPVDSAEED